MTYGERLRASWSGFWKSKSLLSVMILDFVLTLIVGILFYLGDLAIVAWLNKEKLAAMPVEQFNWVALLNPKTIIVVGIILLMQGFIITYIDSFFRAGFYGMMKNALQDGTTKFAEFMPSAKRYWQAVFRLELLRFGLFFIVAIPFIIALISVLATAPLFVTTTQWVFFAVTLVLGAIVGLLIFFWLLYGEAIIVFEDATMTEAVKGSKRLAGDNAGKSVVVIITFFAITIIGSLLSTLVGLPFEVLAAMTKMTLWQAVAEFVKFLTNLITLSAGIVASFFIFYTYRDLTTRVAARKVAVAIKPTTKPIKKKK